MTGGLALVLSAITSFTLFIVFGLRATKKADATSRFDPSAKDAPAEGAEP